MIMRNRRALVRHLKTDNICFSGGDAAGCLLWIQPATKPIISDSIDFPPLLFLTDLLKTLRCAETRIRISLFNKQSRVVLINFTPLGLTIRSILPAMKWTLVWGETKPL